MMHKRSKLYKAGRTIRLPVINPQSGYFSEMICDVYGGGGGEVPLIQKSLGS